MIKSIQREVRFVLLTNKSLRFVYVSEKNASTDNIHCLYVEK